MRAASVRVPSAAAYFQTQSLARGLGRFLLVASVLGVLFAATFPFDFSLPAQERFEWVWHPYDPALTDRTQNVIFFTPFGFALASMIPPTRRYRRTIQLVLSLLLGGTLTALVETLQQYVSFRDPSLADLWCNTLGSVVGAAVYVLIGDRVLRIAASGLLKLRILAKPIVLAVVLLLYSAGQLAAPLLLRNAGDMSHWDHDVWLWLGANAKSGTPWNGNLWTVTLSDRAATPEEIAQLAKGAEPAPIFGESLLGDYRTIGSAPFIDQANHLSPLEYLQKEIEPIPTTAPSNVTERQTLRSASRIAAAVHRIARSAQFTIATTLATWNQEERGPAIVLTIAGDDRPFNIVVGQEYTDLTLRLRTAVRGAPQLHLRNVFANNNKRHIAITQKDAQTIVYVDGREQGRVEVTPEAKVIWRLYPRGHFRMWINNYGFRSYAAMYRLLVFLPFAALLGAMLATVKWKPAGKRLVGISATVLMALTLEIILGTQSGSGFQPINLAISIAIGLLALGGLAWWRKRSVSKRKVQF